MNNRLPHSSRVNYNDHYVSSAIRARTNKTGGITTVQTQINNQNRRGIVERSNFNITTTNK